MVGPSELYVLTGALASKRENPTLRELARELQVDHTFVHRALRRAAEAGLYDAASKRVNEPNFEELVVHSARFIAPAELGGLTAGVEAAWAAEPVSARIRQAGGSHRQSGRTLKDAYAVRRCSLCIPRR